MGTISVSSLSGCNFSTLYKTYVNAIAGYSTPYSISEQQFDIGLQQIGYDPSLSFGAFEGAEQLVGVWLSGYRHAIEGRTGYGAGTAVIPEQRGRGLATRLFRALETEILNRGLDRYTLIVDHGNVAAHGCYRTCGFGVERVLHSYRLNKSQFNGESRRGMLNVHEVSIDDVVPISAHLREYVPTWANAIEPGKHVPGFNRAFIVEGGGQVHAYGIAQPERGRINQIGFLPSDTAAIAVTMILQALYMCAEDAEEMHVIDVPDSAKLTADLLMRVGCEKVYPCSEMVKIY